MRNLLIIAFCLILFSCTDDKDNPLIKPEIGDNAVFVINEGLFTWGNASLSVLNLDKDTVYNHVFEQTNNAPLGDVGQSVCFHDSLAFIVVNNSGKIYAIDAYSFQYKGEITGLSSPREICFASADKAYISDLLSNNLTIFNPEDYTLLGSINLKHNSESMLLHNNLLFVLNWSYGNQLLVVDTDTDQVIDSLETGLQPNSMVMDKNDKFWVLCDGGFAGIPGGQQLPRLQCIDPISFEIEKDFEFSGYEWLTKKLSINAAGDSLFYISGSIYAMSIDASELPTTPIIQNQEKTFYGMGIDPTNSNIYVTDAKDYTQSGMLYRYSSQGDSINSYEVGIVPGDIGFR